MRRLWEVILLIYLLCVKLRIVIFRVIRLKNGLRALLISDLNSLKEKCGEVRSILHDCDEVTDDVQWMDGVHSGSESESEGSSIGESDTDQSVDEDETDEDIEDNEGRRHASRNMDSGDEKMVSIIVFFLVA